VDAPRREPAGALTAAGLLLAASNLRPTLVALSPLLPEIRRSTGISSTLAGLLTTIPLVCFGIFAFVTPRLSRRFGRDRLLALALAGVAIGTVVRLQPSPLSLFGGTVLAGAAIAVGNVVLPSLVKRDFPEQVPLLTAAYAVALTAGAALAAGVTVPLQHLTGDGWRVALALWSVPAAVAFAVLVISARRAPRHVASAVDSAARARHAATRDGSGRMHRDSVAWSVMAFMGLQSLDFYALLAWMPSILQARGLSASSAGWIVSATGFVAVPFALAAPLVGRRVQRDRALVSAAIVACALGLAGLAFDPRPLALLWGGLVGAGQGATLSLALGFITKRAPTAARVEQLSTAAQGSGYLLAALGPVTVGAVHQLTGSWKVPVLVLAALLAPELLAGRAAARDRYVAAPAPAPGAVVSSEIGRSADDWPISTP
jgi:CP family cyanate transporter-like MFS transporter